MKTKCIKCGKIVDIPLKDEDEKKLKNGDLIINSLSYISLDQREILISRICGECFDKIFEDDEEE